MPHTLDDSTPRTKCAKEMRFQFSFAPNKPLYLMKFGARKLYIYARARWTFTICKMRRTHFLTSAFFAPQTALVIVNNRAFSTFNSYLCFTRRGFVAVSIVELMNRFLIPSPQGGNKAKISSQSTFGYLHSAQPYKCENHHRRQHRRSQFERYYYACQGHQIYGATLN